MENQPTNNPTTIEGIGIHIGYINKSLKELTEKMDRIAHNMVNRDEWIEHLKWNSALDVRLAKHEEKQAETEIAMSNIKTTVYVVGVILGGLFTLLQFVLPYLIR